MSTSSVLYLSSFYRLQAGVGRNLVCDPVEHYSAERLREVLSRGAPCVPPSSSTTPPCTSAAPCVLVSTSMTPRPRCSAWCSGRVSSPRAACMLRYAREGPPHGSRPCSHHPPRTCLPRAPSAPRVLVVTPSTPRPRCSAWCSGRMLSRDAACILWCTRAGPPHAARPACRHPLAPLPRAHPPHHWGATCTLRPHECGVLLTALV